MRLKKPRIFKTDGEAPLFLQVPVKTRDEIIPPGTQGRVVDNFVNRLDLSKVEATYEGGGASAFHPKGLLKVILLAYLNNIYGSRPIAEMAAADLRCYYFLEGGTPSHNTINRFRSRRLGSEGVLDIFRQLIELLLKEGLITFEQTYIDGTLIESRASRTKIVWQQSIRRYAEINARHINEIIGTIRDTQQSEEEEMSPVSPDDSAADKEDKQRGDHRQGSKKEKRPATVHPTKEFIQQTRDKIEGLEISKAKKEDLNRRLDRAEELRKQDEMCGTRSGTATTDPDSVAMHPKNDPMHKGPCLPMYNTMLITNNQFILDYYLGGLASDMALFPLMIKAVGHGYSRSKLVADAGFGSYTNILLAQSYGITPYFKYSNFDKEQAPRYTPDQFEGCNFAYDADTNTLQCPAGQKLQAIRTTTTTEHGVQKNTTTFRTDSCPACPLKDQCLRGRNRYEDRPYREVELNIDWWTNVKPAMQQRLKSELGQELLRRRSMDVEPTNAHIRWAGKYTRFRHFGIKKCKMDLGLRAISQNLLHYLNIALKEGGCPSAKAYFCSILSQYKAKPARLWRREQNNLGIAV